MVWTRMRYNTDNTNTLDSWESLLRASEPADQRRVILARWRLRHPKGSPRTSSKRSQSSDCVPQIRAGRVVRLSSPLCTHVPVVSRGSSPNTVFYPNAPG
ncbi:hypothetical protein HPB50_022526 [Hyalomma asiaticum]|uniref:Uncharacterized protein n=1 Tax=Hyalomma asiaticum TaxID=266040 RepID=A0ACB7S4R3_HYAAI|nr:hypothetical protein HPB50_022526 [Hyalomma asiaticum]